MLYLQSSFKSSVMVSRLTQVQYLLQATELLLFYLQIEKLLSFRTHFVAADLTANCVNLLLVLHEACLQFMAIAAGCDFFSYLHMTAVECQN